MSHPERETPASVAVAGDARRVLGLATIVLAALCGFACPARAHPHVFVTMQTEIVYDDARRIVALQQKWTFDELYSSMAVFGMDANNDGVYTREELQQLADVNVQSLQEYRTFTHIKFEGSQVEVAAPRDHWIEYKDGMLTLHFRSDLAQPVPGDKAGAFAFSVFDPEIYVKFDFAPDAAVRLAGAAPGNCAPVLETPSETADFSRLSEAFFSSPTAANLGSQFAATVSIACGG